jgi:vacuolar iron transporter family protein
MEVKHSIKTGFSFGLTSGIITTLGLIVGLYSSTQSKPAIIGGILIIAIADAFSDALGIHISEEAEIKHLPVEIWTATLSTFFSKFLFSATFLVPVIFLPMSSAIFISIIWGSIMLTLFSYILARQQNEKPLRVIGEHLLIILIVIILTHFIGKYIAGKFG